MLACTFMTIESLLSICMATAARVKYPAALQRCKFDAPLLAAGSLTTVFKGMSICLGESPQSVITDVLPKAFSLQFTGCDQLTESTFDGTYTERRTKFTNVLLVNRPILFIVARLTVSNAGSLVSTSAKRSSKSLQAARTVPSRYFINGTASSVPSCHPFCA